MVPQHDAIASVPHDDAVDVCALDSFATVDNSADLKPAAVPIGANINPDLSTEQTNTLLTLLEKHKALFDTNSSVLGQTSLATHRIETDGSCVVRRRPYCVSPKERKII